MEKARKTGLILSLKEKDKLCSLYFADFETVSCDQGVMYASVFSIVGDGISICECIDWKLDSLVDESAALVDNFLSTCFSLQGEDVIIYLHNFVRFDMYLILRGIAKLGVVVDLISRDNQIYSVSVTSDDRKITFRDSIQMLGMSLLKLTIMYGVTLKQSFNHDNTYEDYANPIFVEEVKSYCLNDSFCLMEAFKAFRAEILSTFGVDCLNCLTISSLSLRIFRCNYYNELDTPIYTPNESKDYFIRASYYGGIVEVMKPRLVNGYHYDVNSLYPSVMIDSDFPIGKGRFINMIDFDVKSFFGFIEVIVVTPNHNMPFLVKNSSKGLISPVGTWKGTYTSVEIQYALTLGYEFKYLKAISFEKAPLFKEFVSDMYRFRIQSGKGSSKGTVVKLIMNSLYGRFGMKLDSNVTSLVSKEEAEEISSFYNPKQYDEIEEMILISYKKSPDPAKLNYSLSQGIISQSEYEEKSNVRFLESFDSYSSVGIASFVTGYARVKMYKYRLLAGSTLCYTDTDSIYSERSLPSEVISETEIGLLKLEYLVDDAYFISPKSYSCISGDVNHKKSKGVSSKLLEHVDYRDAYNGLSKNLFYENVFAIDRKEFRIKKLEKNFTFRSNLNKRVKVFCWMTGKWITTRPLLILELNLN